MDIKGKVALVTGAAGGLGLGFVRIFLSKGCRVCLVDVEGVEGREHEVILKREFGDDMVLFVECDVTVTQQLIGAFDAAEKTLGVVEIVCNNAGIAGEFDIEKVIATNLTALYLGTSIAIERMRKDKGGRGGVIINTGSIQGLYPLWIQPAYGGTKAAIIAYTRAWSENPNLDAMGIRFNCLCPSAVKTPMQNKIHALAKPLVLDEKVHGAIHLTEGYLTVGEVAVAMLRLIEEDRNGDNLLISQVKGTRFVQVAVTGDD